MPSSISLLQMDSTQANGLALPMAILTCQISLLHFMDLFIRLRLYSTIFQMHLIPTLRILAALRPAMNTWMQPELVPLWAGLSAEHLWSQLPFPFSLFGNVERDGVAVKISILLWSTPYLKSLYAMLPRETKKFEYYNSKRTQSPGHGI